MRDVVVSFLVRCGFPMIAQGGRMDAVGIYGALRNLVILAFASGAAVLAEKGVILLSDGEHGPFGAAFTAMIVILVGGVIDFLRRLIRDTETELNEIRKHFDGVDNDGPHSEVSDGKSGANP
jgi:hypothetical protein